MANSEICIYNELKLQRLVVYFILYSPIGNVTVVDEGSVVDEDSVVNDDDVVETEVVTTEVLTKSQGKNKKQGLLSGRTFRCHNTKKCGE